MSGPIILGSFSYTILEFSDRFMVAKLGTDALAAVGSAGVWSWCLGVLVLGVCGCVSTFVAQCYGKEQFDRCASYAWQGVYLSAAAVVLALVLWPTSTLLFQFMGHTPEVTQLEMTYFHIRLIGYMPLAAATALSAFFQAVNRPSIPMYMAILCNTTNIVLNLLLIFGTEALGIPAYTIGGVVVAIPALGIAGAAIATCISQFLQLAFLMVLFLMPRIHNKYQSRTAWRYHAGRIRELVRIGMPAGLSMFVDIATWGIFISFVVGRFGAVPLAANNIALSFMMLSFMPVVALNQGIAPIVGQWIGRRDIPRAKARTFTSIKMAMGYMWVMGSLMAIFGGKLITTFFSDDPMVITLGHRLLIVAAIFQTFDAVCIVCQGALRGAGDTRWLMFITLVAAYPFFLPLASVLAFVLDWGALGAWIGAAIYIIVLSFVMFARFQGEKWRNINIFSEDDDDGAVPVAAGLIPDTGIASPVGCDVPQDRG